MSELLISFALLLSMIVLISFLNEKFFKMPKDIALVLFSFVVATILKICFTFDVFNFENEIMPFINEFRFDEFLMEGILCFMLFAGASKIHFSHFVVNIKAISLLALLSTVLTSAIYGILFYLVNIVFGLGFDIWLCILLGCIVSPTDPIAATSILNKVGLSKNVTSVIEGESLFNDGTGVALFVCIKNIVSDTSDESFFVIISKEILGAVAVALVISFLLFQLLKRTNDPTKHIFISLLAVSLIYVICEELGFSGVIASVCCGMYFSHEIDKNERWRAVIDTKDYYKVFWDLIDVFLNSILFVLIGFSVLYISGHEYIIWLGFFAIVINLISRYTGVLCSSLLVGKRKMPNRYSTNEFVTLMTWSGLKGGLSLALALSTKQFLAGQYEVYNIILLMTWVTMIFTTVFQGLSTAKVFKLVEKKKTKRMSSKLTKTSDPLF